MLGFWRKKKIPTFWHPRKLMACYIALQLKEKSSYTIHNFLLPFRYPLSNIATDWEAFRIFECLLQLKADGIKVKDIYLDEGCLGIVDILPAYEKSTYYKLFNFFRDRHESRKALKISISEYQKYCFPSYQDDSLFKDSDVMKYGSGDIWVHPDIPFSVQGVSLVLPSYLSFDLEINVKTLGKSLNTYISNFREEKLVEPSQNYFGFSFAKKVFRALLDRLSFRQSKKSVLSFRSTSGQNISDEFQEVFLEKYPQEFNLWQKQTYVFPWWETLLALEQTHEIEIHDLAAKIDSVCPQEQRPNMRWHGIDQESLQFYLRCQLVPPEPLEPGTQELEVIEVVKSTSDKYIVYLNENHVHSLLFSKKTKLGHLLYRLAEDGYVPYDKHLKKTLEYVKDKRCKLWSKTPYRAKQVFEVDEDGYVLPKLNVSIRATENQ